jgi:phosphohistidine phosphatase SixA
VTLFLLRHAQAGTRAGWPGTAEGLDDMLRPLTAQGRYQSADLVGLLGEMGITEIRSSPYRRCLETVAPLAAALGLDVIVDERLAEGPADGAIALARAMAETSTVLCSHGDILPAILDHLRLNDALDLGPDPRCQKASTWICEPNRAWAGHFAEATYLVPPTSSK